jgi:hypothetical protein
MRRAAAGWTKAPRADQPWWPSQARPPQPALAVGAPKARQLAAVGAAQPLRRHPQVIAHEHLFGLGAARRQESRSASPAPGSVRGASVTLQALARRAASQSGLVARAGITLRLHHLRGGSSRRRAVPRSRRSANSYRRMRGDAAHLPRRPLARPSPGACQSAASTAWTSGTHPARLLDAQPGASDRTRINSERRVALDAGPLRSRVRSKRSTHLSNPWQRAAPAGRPSRLWVLQSKARIGRGSQQLAAAVGMHDTQRRTQRPRRSDSRA